MELLKREIEGKKGIILIMALWIMTILSVLAVSFAFMMRTEMKMAGNYRNGVQAHYLALAGVEHAIAAILNDATIDAAEDDYTDHYDEAWHEEFRDNWVPADVTWGAKEFNFGEGTYAVHLSDENSKLNLNYANASGVWDLMATDAIDDAYFHRKTCNILDYRDGSQLMPPFTNEWGTGSIVYNSQSGSEGTWCKDNFFDTVYEIQKVTGINFGDDGVYDNPLDENPGRGSELDMTVYSQDRNTQVDGSARIDINNTNQGDLVDAIGSYLAPDPAIDCVGILDDAPYTKYGYPLVGDPDPGMGIGAVAWVGENQYSISETEMMNIADKIKIGPDNIIKGTVNINTATDYGLRGLFNISGARATLIITERNTEGPFAHRGEIMNVGDIKRMIMQQCGDIITVRSDRFRIYSTGTFGSAVRRIEAVVDRDGDEDGSKDDIKILYWSEKVFED